MVALGANFWPLQLARELDDAILHIRLNELDVAAIVFKSSGDPAQVLAYDRFLDANQSHWLAREIRLLWKRTLKRVDLTSRSLVTLIEPGSCFAGTLAELPFASDRSYMLVGLREPVWQDVPGEYRAMLRRLIVIQGDTEPASVEQQRHLGKTAPSLYDLRNVFQVNVEEGRHLWAMVYLLQKYFGRDGREEAAELLQRRSGDADKPRMLGAFNEATPDWLSFHMFTFFTDRDGKMQLESLAQSGFDPLSRTCRFMLTEEAHHMFVGETGVGRTIQRTCEAMQAAGIDDPNDIGKVRALGVIDLPTMQKKLNLHYTLSLDLFGSEVSTNAANCFTAGIKGRFQETKIDDDHRLEHATYPVLKFVGGEIKRVDEPALTAINMRLRDDYTADCQRGLDRWNKIIDKTGVVFQVRTAACRLPPPDRRVQGRACLAGGAHRR